MKPAVEIGRPQQLVRETGLRSEHGQLVLCKLRKAQAEYAEQAWPLFAATGAWEGVATFRTADTWLPCVVPSAAVVLVSRLARMVVGVIIPGQTRHPALKRRPQMQVDP